MKVKLVNVLDDNELIASGEVAEDGSVDWNDGPRVKFAKSVCPVARPGDAGYFDALSGYLKRSSSMDLVLE
jgi:hypothetical protein